MANTILELSHIGYTYQKGSPDEKQALKDVSFSVKAGERVALLGANGSGKSTLLSCIDTICFPQTGKMKVDEREVCDNKKDRRYVREKVGYIFQEPDRSIFCADLFEELSFGCMNLGLPPDEVKRRVGAVIEELDMGGLTGRPTYALSGGQKKLVTIAAVLAMQPDIVLMDEPESGLDPRHRAILTRVLDNMKKRGQAVIISTHDLDFALGWADTWVILHEGTAVSYGPALETAMSFSYDEFTGLTPPSVVEDVRTLRKSGVLELSEGSVRSRAQLMELLAEKYGVPSRN